jgi:hypothetical protein
MNVDADIDDPLCPTCSPASYPKLSGLIGRYQQKGSESLHAEHGEHNAVGSATDSDGVIYKASPKPITILRLRNAYKELRIFEKHLSDEPTHADSQPKSARNWKSLSIEAIYHFENTLSPISRLPDDVLQAIMLLLVRDCYAQLLRDELGIVKLPSVSPPTTRSSTDDDGMSNPSDIPSIRCYDKPPWIFCFVSRRWYNAAISYGSLWSYLNVEDLSFSPPLLQTYLARSKESSLHVFINTLKLRWEMFEQIRSSLEMLFETAGRWRYATMYISGSQYDVFKRKLKNSMGQLEELGFGIDGTVPVFVSDADTDGDAEDSDSEQESDLQESDITSMFANCPLKRLTYCNYSNGSPSSIPTHWQTITHLRLKAPGHYDYAEILSKSPQLMHLRLEGDVTIRTPVFLNNVTWCEFESSTYDGIRYMNAFRNLRLPSIQTLGLRFWSEQIASLIGEVISKWARKPVSLRLNLYHRLPFTEVVYNLPNTFLRPELESLHITIQAEHASDVLRSVLDKLVDTKRKVTGETVEWPLKHVRVFEVDIWRLKGQRPKKHDFGSVSPRFMESLERRASQVWGEGSKTVMRERRVGGDANEKIWLPMEFRLRSGHKFDVSRDAEAIERLRRMGCTIVIEEKVESLGGRSVG